MNVLQTCPTCGPHPAQDGRHADWCPTPHGDGDFQFAATPCPYPFEVAW